MVTKQDVIDALKQVFDPEIPISVYDLGLILDINIKEETDVYIKMTLTTPACPMRHLIIRSVEGAVKKIPGVRNVVIDLVFDAPWSIKMIRPGFRKKMTAKSKGENKDER